MKKVCVYEDPTMFGTHGITSAVANQRKALDSVGVEISEKLKSDSDVIHLNWPGPISYLQALKSNKSGKLTITFAHSGRDVVGGFTLSNILAPMFIKWFKLFHAVSDVVVAPSNYAKEMISDIGVEKSKTKVISNGVNAEKVQFSQQKREDYRKKFDLNKPTVIGVGQVIPRKGLVTFAKVAEMLPQYQFVWFGPRMNKLAMYDREMNKVIENPPANVKFTGYVEDIQGAYSAGDLFFFPSHEENEGIVLLEAAIRKIPIVARDLPVYNGWLEDGEHCLLGEKAEEFSELIVKAVEDEKLKEHLTEKAKYMAEERKLENIGQKYLKLYEEFT